MVEFEKDAACQNHGLSSMTLSTDQIYFKTQDARLGFSAERRLVILSGGTTAVWEIIEGI